MKQKGFLPAVVLLKTLDVHMKLLLKCQTQKEYNILNSLNKVIFKQFRTKYM
jgi:hypothetical protein